MKTTFYLTILSFILIAVSCTESIESDTQDVRQEESLREQIFENRQQLALHISDALVDNPGLSNLFEKICLMPFAIL